MTVKELREKYLQFMQKQGHIIVPSASLVPQNDPTTLFTSSGMQPMITYLLGEPHPEGTRIADSQKCFGAEDIDEVGDNRHTTFFEMLGNWSLGDYFKKEQLEWIWDFVINELKLDPNKLYATVYSGGQISEDKEAIEFLQSIFKKHNITSDYKPLGSVEEGYKQGMGSARIFGYNKKNWWSRAGAPDKMPAGEPGGPDSEIFYDYGTPHDTSYGEHCHPNCDCGRFLEIGNSVFMQYRKREDGTFEELPKKNIDFGGGLERMLAVATGKQDIFLSPTHYEIIQKLEQLSGKSYSDSEYTKHFRIIADHLKAATMLASDGVIPSNKMQGYMMRRLIRRSVASANALGLQSEFTKEIVAIVQNMYQYAYPEVLNPNIQQIITDEETNFRKTLERGFKEIEKNIDEIKKTSFVLNNIALRAFNLFQSYGMPVDITLDQIEKEFGLSLETRQEIQAHYLDIFNQHRELSRSASAGMFKGGLAEHSDITTQYHTATHLLHQALRDVIGLSVAQKGSNITAERLRFDFSHTERLTPVQIQKVEQIVNEKIKEALPVYAQQKPKEEAFDAGSIGLFGEKYPDTVNVYTIGPKPQADELVDRSKVYSREFCGGPHVSNTSEIKGTFKIQKDEKIAKDVVRIKAVLIQ